MSSILWEAAIQQAQQAENATSQEAAQLAQLGDVHQAPLPPIPNDLPHPDNIEIKTDQSSQSSMNLSLGQPGELETKPEDDAESDDEPGSPKGSSRSLNGNYYDRKRSGHRQIMASVSTFLREAVMGNNDGSADYTECMVVFMNEFLNRRENLEIRERIAEFSVKPVIQSIRQAYDAAMDRDKPQMASLVTGHFTRSELSRLGMSISSHSFSAANRHIATRGVGVKVAPPKLPPKRKPLSKQAREELYNFLESNSHRSDKHKVRVPKAGRLEGSKETESMFCRQLDATRAELRRRWKADPNHAQLAQSTFNREIARFRVFKYHIPPHKQRESQEGEQAGPVPTMATHQPTHIQPGYHNLQNLQHLHASQAQTQQVFNQFQVPQLPGQHPQLPPHQLQHQLQQHQQMSQQQGGQQHLHQPPGIHQPHASHPNILLGGIQQMNPQQMQSQMPTMAQSMIF